MGDKGRIILGLAVFLVLATFPIWYTLGSSGQAPAPVLEPPAGAPLVFTTQWSAVRDDSEASLDWKRLQEEFKKHQIPLADGARLGTGEQGDDWRKWRITSADKRYLAVKREGTLSVYAGGCVQDDMAASHMTLLKGWREDVVRQADRTKIDINGKEYHKSLTKCCMQCHTSRERFCGRCHEYANVLPLPPLREFTSAQRAIRCWNCHVQPKED